MNKIIGHSIKLQCEQAFDLAQVQQFELSPESTPAMLASLQLLEQTVRAGQGVYGVSTQFGDQVGVVDPRFAQGGEVFAHDLHERQLNIVRSLNCGMGPLLAPEVVRLAMVLRSHCLAQGYSAVRPALVKHLLDWIQSGATPKVYRFGSIGASGDLIPLATIAAAVAGEPVLVHQNGEQDIRADQLHQPFSFELREGLALINGTSVMTAVAALQWCRLNQLAHALMDIIGFTLNVFCANADAYHSKLHEVKYHPGPIEIAALLQPYLKPTYEGVHTPLQNYYSVRSVCQGFGPLFEHLKQAQETITQEMNAVDDNPIIDVAAGKILHGANFMGYHITSSCDVLKMDVAQACGWLHAMLANLYHPRKNIGLPVNLMADPVSHNGFRGLQLLAASLTVACRKLAQSQQAYQVPTEGDNQDVNSLGLHAALDLEEAVDHLERLCAITYLSAAQAWDYRGHEHMTGPSQKLYNLLRSQVPFRDYDYPFDADLLRVVQLIRTLS